MSLDSLDHLKSLHTAAIDARNGYEEALEDAEGKGMTPLFRQMISLHETNATELAGVLSNAGESPDGNGSFMTTVHRTIMSVRSLFNGLDESVLPGLIGGEQRNVKSYDDALAADGLDVQATKLLETQRERLQHQLNSIQAQKAST